MSIVCVCDMQDAPAHCRGGVTLQAFKPPHMQFACVGMTEYLSGSSKAETQGQPQPLEPFLDDQRKRAWQIQLSLAAGRRSMHQ